MDRKSKGEKEETGSKEKIEMGDHICGIDLHRNKENMQSRM